MEPTTRTTGEGATPRAAATVALLRDSDRGLEVLLTVRPDHLRFMGGAVVFPGGALAPADLDPRWEEASVLDGRGAADALGEDDPRAALGAFVCALREAFEEVGFIVGDGPLEQIARTDSDDPRKFLDRCVALGVLLGTNRLVPAGRWVTPLGAPMRFDTRFFFAATPSGWMPDPDPEEVVEARWATPAEALAELSSGRAIMAPPTVETLQHLDQFGSADDAMAGFRATSSPRPPGVFSTRLSPLVRVVLAPNPSTMTGPGTNTYVVGVGPTLVIDPAVPDTSYMEVVAEVAGGVEAILVTHRHPDHIGGVAALVERTGAPVRAFGDGDVDGVRVHSVADDDIVGVPGAELRALHTPGHASDHLCFFLEGAASLFAGDNILGEGTAVIAPPDGDMRVYLDSLRRLSDFDIDRIYPGHWRPLDGGRQVIERYIAHRKDREQAILNALEGGPATVENIVVRAYTDTPAELHPVARFQALAHLRMLEEDGEVTQMKERWSLSRRIDVE
ncbi:MAG: MBL fold metallo-hydrolase [Actinomycetota bacterium]